MPTLFLPAWRRSTAWTRVCSSKRADAHPRATFVQHPHFVVHLGDLTSTPSPAAYADFIRITRDLPMPQLYVQGNHDDGAMLAQALPLPSDDIEPAGAPDGYYALVRCGDASGGAQLKSRRWHGPRVRSTPTRSCGWTAPWPLAAVSPRWCLFTTSVHAIGIEWLDGLALKNADELIGVLRRHAGVLGLFSGHVHRRTSAEVGGIRSETAPSTWVSFGSDRANPIVDAHQGVLVVDVQDDGLRIAEVLI